VTLNPVPLKYSFWEAFRAHGRVVLALVRRGIVAQYGRRNIGFLWLVVEPMLLIVGVMFMWTLLGRGKGDLPIIPFVLSGYALLNVWRVFIQAGNHFASKERALLYHRQVTIYDIFLTSLFSKFISTTAAATVIYFIVVVIGLSPPFVNVSLVIYGWLLMAAFSFGFAGIVGAWTEASPSVSKFVHVFTYMSLPISGTFFMVDWLSPKQQEVMLLVPIVHCYEMLRAGYFGNQAVTHYDTSYVGLWALVILAGGMWSIHRTRDLSQNV